MSSATKKKNALEMLAMVMAQMQAEKDAAAPKPKPPQWDVDPTDPTDVPTVFGPPAGGGGSGGVNLP